MMPISGRTGNWSGRIITVPIVLADAIILLNCETRSLEIGESARIGNRTVAACSLLNIKAVRNSLEENKMKNYRLQNGCWNCKHRLEDFGHDWGYIFCNFGKPIAPTGVDDYGICDLHEIQQEK